MSVFLLKQSLGRGPLYTWPLTEYKSRSLFISRSDFCADRNSSVMERPHTGGAARIFSHVTTGARDRSLMFVQVSSKSTERAHIII